jgi:hypothetical protein
MWICFKWANQEVHIHYVCGIVLSGLIKRYIYIMYVDLF